MSITDEDRSTHIKIINAISGAWPAGTAFSVWEVRDLSLCSVSSVLRTLDTLIRAGYIKKAATGYRFRYYRVTDRWTNAETVIEAFHYARLLRI